jgi:glycosyltransferase involved in cell wall biosynthesis
MKIAVVTPRMASREVGGAENLYQGLINALRTAGHQAVLIEVMVDESSFENILEAYCRCFYLNLDDYDLVISTKAPTYMIRHRNHVSYLLHTMRVFYDRFESKSDEDYLRKKMIQKFDRYGLSSDRIKKHCVIGETVAKRLKDADPFWNDIDFHVIYPAPLHSDFKEPGEGKFVFLPGRLHRWKRVDLVIQAMKHVKGIKLLVAGEGEDAVRLKQLAKELNVDGKVEFLDRVSDEELLDLYSSALVVLFVPIQEDYGYVTIEAFKSKKPVITCSDSGEPSRIVKDGMNGFVVDPDPMRIAEKISVLQQNPEEAKRLGENGYQSVLDIEWSKVIDNLLKGVVIDAKNHQKVMDVLVADMQPIEPSVGGGRLRLKGLYSNLPENIKATYIGTYDWRGEKPRQVQISDNLVEIDVPLSEEHFKLNECINQMLPGKTIIDVTFPLLAIASSKYVKTLRTEAKKADVIILSHPWTYPIIKTSINLKNKILVYDSHNFEALLRKSILGATPFAQCLAGLVDFVERELCERSDLILACSEEDRELFVSLYGISASKVEIFPNGVDTSKVVPVDEATKRKSKELLKLPGQIAIFIGSDYPPNVEAAEYILKKLAQKCPKVTFIIVGGAGECLKSNRSNVKIFGKVSEEEKVLLYSAADIAINPMLNGSGTNIKMFEYLAAGLPTISSPVGARGIQEEGAFVISELSDFDSAITKILSNNEIYQRLSSSARALAEGYYDWKKISFRLGERINTLYEETRPFFSIVIPMYRGEHIEELIEHLNCQTFKDFEVIIVDSGRERRGELLNICNFKFKYIFDEFAGATKARNIGIKAAKGEVVAFTDDDCRPDADWLSMAKEHLEKKGVVGLEGFVYTDEGKMNDPKYRVVTNKGFPGIGFMTANLFIRRDILEIINGFDERFDKPHFREDTDLAWRALEYGLIPFAEDVRVYHPPHLRNENGEAKRDRERFFINDALLFSKHPIRYVQLMKAEGHYIRSKDFWKYFAEGMRLVDDGIPLDILLNDPEISRYVPSSLKSEFAQSLNATSP